MSEILKTLERGFRHAVVYPLFRLILRNKKIDAPIDLAGVSKLLILRGDGIGDMLVSTSIFRILKKFNPGLRIGVFASERNESVIRYNPNIDRIHILHRNWRNLGSELLAARREQYDVVMNFVFNRTTSEGLLANIVSPHGIKIGQGLDKYEIYFNRLLKLERSTMHMVQVLATMVDAVFATNFVREDLHLEIFVDDESRTKVDRFLGKHSLHRRAEPHDGKGHYVVINFSAIDRVRRMSPEQVVEIVRWITKSRNAKPVLIFPPSEREVLDSILRDLDHSQALVYPEEGAAGLLELASLIEGASFTITCDTSIVHFSSATRTPVFVLFTPTAAKNHEWTPFGVPHRAIYAKLGEGVYSIPIAAILSELNPFMSSGEVRRSQSVSSQ